MKGGKREGAGPKKVFLGSCKNMTIYMPTDLREKIKKKSERLGVTPSRYIVEVVACDLGEIVTV